MQQIDLVNIIANSAKFFATTDWLTQNYYAYAVTITLPVSHGDKTAGLNDLIAHHPFIMSRISLIFKDNFGAWVCDRRSDRGHSKAYFHRHAVIFCKQKINTKEAEELVTAYLAPLGLARANDGKPAVQIRRVRSLRAWLAYMAKHKPTPETYARYGQFHAAKSWGVWPQNVSNISSLFSLYFLFFWGWHFAQSLQPQRFAAEKMQGCRPHSLPPLLAFLFVVFSPKNKNIKIFCRASRAERWAHAGVVGGLAPLRQACLTYRAVNFERKPLFYAIFRRWYWPMPRGPGPPSVVVVCSLTFSRCHT